MNCQQCLHELCGYLDDELNSALRTEFDNHLEKCRKCRIVCQTTQSTIRLYRHLSLASVPAEVEGRLMSAIQTRMAVSKRR